MSKKPDLLTAFILLASLVLLNVYCLNININTDSSFSLRYVLSLSDQAPDLLVVQPGNRLFPEWAYSFLIAQVTQDPLLWSRLMIAINTLLLAGTTCYFASTLGLKQRDAINATAMLLLITPATALLHHHYHIYFIHSPGIHGHYVPYILLAFALSLQLLNRATATTNPWHGLFYVLVLAACAGSNIAFVLAVVPSLMSVILWQSWKQETNLKKVSVWALLTFTGLALSWLWVALVAHLDAFSLKSLGSTWFNQSFIDWLSLDNRYLHQVADREISGYAAEIMVASLVSSVVVLVLHLRKASSNSLTVVNLLYMSWVPVFLLAMWAVDKENIRHTPFLLLAAPAMLIINVLSWWPNSWSRNLYWTTIAVFLCATSATLIYFDDSKPYIQNHRVMDLLKQLKNEGQINHHGLSDYWVANMAGTSPFTMAPIMPNGRPHGFANDLLDVWQWQDQQPSHKNMTFIVNKCSLSNQCALRVNAIKRHYGPWDQRFELVDNNKIFYVYVYSQGIDLKVFYQQMERLVKYHKPVIHQSLFNPGS